MPEVYDEGISEYERSEEPVDPVDDKVVVDLLSDVLPSERAIIGVDVELILEAVIYSNMFRVVLFPKVSSSFGSLYRSA